MDLDQIKADVVYPFLFDVYTDYELGTLTRDEVLEIVNIVTSYIFRRAVCRIPTNSLNKTFAGFSSSVRKDRYVNSVKAHFIGLKSYRAFPAPTPSSWLRSRPAICTTSVNVRTSFECWKTTAGRSM